MPQHPLPPDITIEPELSTEFEGFSLDDFSPMGAREEIPEKPVAQPEFEGVSLDSFGESAESMNFDFTSEDRGEYYVATKEDFSLWDVKGPIGVSEYSMRFQDSLELVPFIGAAALYEPGTILWKANRLTDDDYGPTETALKEQHLKEVTDFARHVEELKYRGMSIGSDFYAGGTQSATFFVELALSLGTYPIVKKGIKEGAEEGLEQGIRKGLMASLQRGLGKTAGVLGREAKRTAHFMPHRVGLNFLDRRINEHIAVTDKGNIVLQEAKTNPATTFFKSFGDIWIENVSEAAGGELLKPAAGFIGRALPTGLVSKFKEAIPKNKLTQLTGKVLTFSEKKVLYNGIVAEYGEERLGDLLRNHLGIDESLKDASLYDKTVEALFPDARQVLVEVGIISLFGVTSKTSQVLTDRWSRRGLSDSEIEVRKSMMSQTEMDAALNDELVKEAKIEKLKNADKKKRFEGAYQNVVNRFQPIEDVAAEAKAKGVKLKATDDPLLLSRQYLGIGPMIRSTLEDATYQINADGTNTITGEGLKPIIVDFDLGSASIESKQDTRHEDLQDYLIARRTLEDLSVREDVKLTDDQINKAVSDITRLNEKYGEKVTELEATAKRLYGFQSRVLYNLVEAGQMSQEQYEDILAKNQHYIPFDRVIPGETAEGERIKKAFTKAAAPIRKIKGSELEIENVFESVIKNTTNIMERAQRNRVARSVAQLADVLPGQIVLAEIAEEEVKEEPRVKKVKPTMRPIKLTKEEAGEEGKVIFRPSQLAPKGNVIEYYEDGKRKFIQVDQELYDAMTGMTEQQLALYMKILAAPAKALRVGATITPDFMASNFIRDQFTAALQTNIGFRPFIDSISSIADIVGKKGDYLEWIRSGGAYSGIVETSRDSMGNAYKELMGQESLLKKLNIITRLGDLSQVFEQATRIGIFKAAKRKGLSPAEAAFEAREGTLDFARRGAKTKNINAVKAFFNAQVQGFDKTIRSYRKNPAAVTMKGIAYITTPTILLYLINRDDDEYWELPQWKRDMFWNMKVPNPTAPGNVWITIPKPFGWGQIFGTIPERFMAYVDEKDRNAFDGLVRTVYESVSPVSSPDVILPTAFVPIIEGMTNFNFFMGRDMVPAYKEELEPFMQFNKNTSTSAKELGEILNMSPAKIDNTIRGYLGSTGKYALETSDFLVHGIKRSAGEKVVEPPTDITDWPFVRRFVRSEPYGFQSESVQRFYDISKKVTAISKTAKAIKKTGDWDRYNEYRENNEHELTMFKTMSSARKKISGLGKQVEHIIASDIEDTEKLSIIKDVEKRMTELAKNTLDLYETREQK